LPPLESFYRSLTAKNAGRTLIRKENGGRIRIILSSFPFLQIRVPQRSSWFAYPRLFYLPESNLCDLFEYVDRNKILRYIGIIIFKIEKLNAVLDEISKLERHQQDLLKIDYETIENKGIEFVKVKHLQDKIFEIKTKEIRSLFKYQSGRIILIGVVFVKKTQKTPKEMIILAKQRLKEV
jgi:phage-related protein